MQYKIQYNSLQEYYNANKDKYKDYVFDKFKNQEKFNEIFTGILKEKEKHNVFIFVDHDSDGIHSGLIMKEVFTNLRIKHFLYIHDRTNAYGINEDIIAEHFMKEDFTVFISADLGITNRSEIEFLRDNWNPIIIISDHHSIQDDKYPKDADVVINPKLSIEKTAEYVCGAGLVHQIFKPYFENQTIKIFSAIATIGDMTPLDPMSINRDIVKEGLRIINNEKIENNQLRFMFENIYGWGTKIITEMDIAFNIVPIINSLSRYYIQNTIKEYYGYSHGYNLLYGIMKLNNDKRKEDQKKLEKQAEEKIQNNDVNVIVLETDQKNILGIVSSYVVNRHSKPNVVLVKTEYGYSGSGRSNDTLNIFEKFMSFPSKWYNSIGGHPKAMGISIKNEYFEDFKNEVAKIKLPQKEQTQVIEITNYDFENALIPVLKLFSPFGEGNITPRFLLKNMVVEKVRTIRDHCFITASFNEENSFDNNYIEICYFSFTKKLKKHERFNCIGTIDINKTFYVEEIEVL